VAQINQGGTGQTTRVAALNALLPDQAGSTQYMLLTDGSGTVSWGAQPVAGLPSQTSNSGRLLTTNGSTASWSNAVTVSGSNATVGGTLTVTGALTTSSIVNNGANGVALDTGGSASLRFTDSATSKWWIYKLSGDPVLYFRDMLNARMQMVMTPGATSSAAVTTLSSRVFIEDTTASTTTSSGALVVGNGTSGGLGVGGALYVGSAGTFGGTVRVSTANGTAATFSLLQAGQQQWAVEIPASTTNLRLRAVDAAVDALTLGTNGNLTGAGSITTAAPTGGTAAAWKLGAVATVSPTSPNRTIEVDIGGTIYYIHAKTTNN
jgi:hypothetical protein